MKTLDLTFVTRAKLADILGNAIGPLGKISALQAVFHQVRFTEPELATIQRVDVGAGRVIVSAPEGSNGKQIRLEDSQAQVLLAELESWGGFQIADLDWLDDLKRQLKPTTVVMKQRKRETA